jgi:hypothetical protein
MMALKVKLEHKNTYSCASGTSIESLKLFQKNAVSLHFFVAGLLTRLSICLNRLDTFTLFSNEPDAVLFWPTHEQHFF